MSGTALLLAALAFDADVRSDPELDVGAVDRDQLGDPQAGVKRECEHRAVAPSFPAVLWRRLDHRHGLLGGEEGHDPSVESLGGDAQHTGDHRGMFGVAQRGVAEQCADQR